MTTKEDLLTAEDERWGELCARLRKLEGPRRADVLPGVAWSVKDVMAHVATWHAVAVDELEHARATGELKRAWGDVDAFNAEAYERCRDLSASEVESMFAASRHRFREEVALLDAEPAERIARLVRGNGSEHYDEHIEQLDALLEAK